MFVSVRFGEFVGGTRSSSAGMASEELRDLKIVECSKAKDYEES